MQCVHFNLQGQNRQRDEARFVSLQPLDRLLRWSRREVLEHQIIIAMHTVG